MRVKLCSHGHMPLDIVVLATHMGAELRIDLRQKPEMGREN
jgi:hypothetical protein